MPMRQDCKYFESRSYPNGDTVRKCDLDLAPEAPWRCPENCPKYTRRLVDVSWNYGSLAISKGPQEPESLGRDDSIGDLLDAAEEIVNSAAPSVIAEVELERRGLRGHRKGRRRHKKKSSRRMKQQPPKSRRTRTKGGDRIRRKDKRNRGHGFGRSSGDSWGEKFRKRFREGH